jgi:hypothetical protein
MTTPRSRSRRPTPRTFPANELPFGTWSARWGDWVIHLRGQAGTWRATVWRWTLGGGYTERTQLDARAGFATAADATTWACDVLRESGAKVYVVDRPALKLETVLRFNAAPEAVT